MTDVTYVITAAQFQDAVSIGRFGQTVLGRTTAQCAEGWHLAEDRQCRNASRVTVTSRSTADFDDISLAAVRACRQ